MQPDESWVSIGRGGELDGPNITIISDGLAGKASIDGHHCNSLIAPKNFPPEIWYLIIKCATLMPKEFDNGDASRYTSGKVKMRVLRNLATLSKFHRRAVLECWAHTVHFFEQNDISELLSLMKANNLDALRYVRRLVCEDSYRVYKAPKGSFDAFKFLEELVLVCHSDINFGDESLVLQQHAAVPAHGDQPQPLVPEHHENNGDNAHEQQEALQPRMSYRRLRAGFPSGLRKLKVYESHVPDIYFIKKVVDECPLLQSLTLARCTIFTCGRCKFWKSLPRTESDAYFSNQGVTAYAAALGKELKKIKHLEELRIGIYLTDHAAIDTHLTQHAGLDTSSGDDPAVWRQACEQCAHQYQAATIKLEQEATAILAKEVSTLRSVSWASFCSNKRTGWSMHPILRDADDQLSGLASPVIHPE